jgi:hypothetical protein
MSSIGGLNNIRDGLVLFVDTANLKVFKGEPTTHNRALTASEALKNYNATKSRFGL